MSANTLTVSVFYTTIQMFALPMDTVLLQIIVNVMKLITDNTVNYSHALVLYPMIVVCVLLRAFVLLEIIVLVKPVMKELRVKPTPAMDLLWTILKSALVMVFAPHLTTVLAIVDSMEIIANIILVMEFIMLMQMFVQEMVFVLHQTHVSVTMVILATNVT